MNRFQTISVFALAALAAGLSQPAGAAPEDVLKGKNVNMFRGEPTIPSPA